MAAAAVTVYEVGTVKDLPGIRTYVSVDGGMSDNPRPVLYGSGYETLLARAPEADRPRLVTVVGKHCESGDLLVREARVPADLAVGDDVATAGPAALAYTHGVVPEATITAGDEGATLVLLAGDPYGEDLLMFWNFVGEDEAAVRSAL